MSLSKFENFEHEELEKSLKELSRQLSTLKNLVKAEIRFKTPTEIYNDYFLEFKEVDKFRVKVNGSTNWQVGPITINLNKMIDISIAESEFNRILNKLQSVKKRLENDFNFDCHFKIKLNGQNQCDWNPITYRNDDFKFKGVGNKNTGYDGEGHYYTDNMRDVESRPNEYKLVSPDLVSLEINFYII